MKRFLTILLVVALLAGMMAGCGATIVIENADEVEDPKETKQEATMDHSQSEDPEPTASEPAETEPEVDVDGVLLSALLGQTPVQTQDGWEMPLNTYLMENYSAFTDQYAFVDFDHDGTNELAAMGSTMDIGYVVLRYANEKVYAFIFGFRAMMGLTKEGHFTASNGMSSMEFCGLEFSGEYCNIVSLAKLSENGTVYEVNGENCSQAEYESRVNELSSEDALEWLDVTQLCPEKVLTPDSKTVWKMIWWGDNSECGCSFVFAEDGQCYAALSMGFEFAGGAIGTYSIEYDQITIQISFDGMASETLTYLYKPITGRLLQTSMSGLAYNHALGDSFVFQKDTIEAEKIIELSGKGSTY